MRPQRRWTTRAYELFWDIPRENDLLELDILALECVGDLTFVFGPGQTCRQTLEQGVTVDDSGIGGRTTSGDIVRFAPPISSSVQERFLIHVRWAVVFPEAAHRPIRVRVRCSNPLSTAMPCPAAASFCGSGRQPTRRD